MCMHVYSFSPYKILQSYFEFSSFIIKPKANDNSVMATMLLYGILQRRRRKEDPKLSVAAIALAYKNRVCSVFLLTIIEN
jgi:hypothetical protein